MVVYWEYAFVENFMLDGLLVYLALKCARGKVHVWRLLLAAVLGAVEAIVFPLISLPVWCAYLIKFSGGALLILIAVSGGTPKTYLVASAAFFSLTFALGGLLTAVYSFFDVAYEEGSGYLVEGAPVGLILGGAGIFAVAVTAAARAFYRYKKVQQNLFECHLSHGERQVHWRGLADSGNCLSFHMAPVCVISAQAAFALFGRDLKEVGRIHVGTVNGGREAPVFCCERMQVNGKLFEHVLLTVGEINSKDYQLILHTSYVEGEHETARCAETVATGDQGE